MWEIESRLSMQKSVTYSTKHRYIFLTMALVQILFLENNMKSSCLIAILFLPLNKDSN